MATKTKSKPTKAAAKPAKPKVVKEPKPCECIAVTEDGGETHVPCGQTTARRFAPGHDAKLKGALIRAAAAGRDFVTIDGGSRHSVDPLARAAQLGWGEIVGKAVERERKLQAATEARQAKAAERKAEAAAEKAAKAEAKAAAKADKPKAGFHPIQVKIGRVTYDATIQSESPNGVVVNYKDRSGNSKTATVKRSQIVA